MTKIKLLDGTIINADGVAVVRGALNIVVSDNITVEKLAELFSNKENTSLITLMTESGVESGYKVGFTSFAGINYDEAGNKTIELFQPVDELENRVANAEGVANSANTKAAELEATVNTLLGTTAEVESNE